MDEKRKFKVGDLVDAKHWDGKGRIKDGVINQVLVRGNDYLGRKDAYDVVHACDPEWGDVFLEEEVKPRSADDAWRAGHLFLGDWVVADDGFTSFEGVIEKFVADGDRPYKVHDRITKQSGFFGDAHLKPKYQRRGDTPLWRLQVGDWVVADDGSVRFEDAVIGRDPMGNTEGRPYGWHHVYAADGSGDVRLWREDHLRPRTNPVPLKFRDPEGKVPDWKWVHDAAVGARYEAFQESRRQSAEAEAEVLPKDSSLYKHLYPEQPQRPIVSGFRGVLMWIAAIPVATLTAESLAPGAGQTVSLILVISSAGVVPWIANRMHP